MKRAPKKLAPLPVRAARVLARLKHLRGLDDGEKSLHALGLAATPQERWELWEQSVRSFGYWTRSKRNKSAAKKAVGRDKDKLHILHIRDFLRCRREAGSSRARRD